MRINTFYIFLSIIVLGGLALFYFRSEKTERTINEAAEQASTEQVITSSTSSLPPPTGLRGEVISTTRVHLTWNSVDSPLAAGYRVTRNGIQAARVFDPRFGDDAVTAGNSYEYYVQTIDTLGRPSLPSETIVVRVVESSEPASTPASTPIPTPTPTPSPTPTPDEEDGDDETSDTPATSSQNYTIAVTATGVFTPTTQTIRLGDSITFTYSSSGDEVVLSFSPSIGTSVKLDHERTSRTVTIATPGNYTFHKTDGGTETGTIVVTP